VLILWITFALLAVAAGFDLHSREIPHTVTGLVFGLGLSATALGWNGITWPDMALGVLLGFGVSLGLYQLGGLAGGDVKLIAAMGAVLGWKAELGVLFYIAIFGGLLALIARWRKEREYAYAPAIALGLLAYIGRGYWR
jgi:Flp pilus assembly protein protease CpaA